MSFTESQQQHEHRGISAEQDNLILYMPFKRNMFSVHCDSESTIVEKLITCHNIISMAEKLNTKQNLRSALNLIYS